MTPKYCNKITRTNKKMILDSLIAAFILLTLSTIYNIYIPLGEAPDEPGHMRYILFLAREQRLPVQHPDQQQSDVPGEGHQPPLAYALALPAVFWLPASELQFLQQADPDFIWNGGNSPAAFIRTSSEYFPWSGTTLAWHLARAISSLVGAITVVLVGYATYSLRKQEDNATPRQIKIMMSLAILLTTLNPQFLFTSAITTNDALLTMLSAGLLCLCILQPATTGNVACNVSTDGTKKQHTLLLMMLRGIVLGFALLTKQSALLFIPMLMWCSWRDAKNNVRAAIAYTFIWSIVAFVIAGWWYVRNWLLYGDPMGIALFQTAFRTQPFNWQDPSAWLSGLTQLHTSFWAMFGWLSVKVPTWLIAVYAVFECIALAGWGKLLWQHIQNRDKGIHHLSQIWLIPLLLLLLTFVWLVSFALTAGLVAWQGRLLFPALPAIAILLARGIAVWFDSIKTVPSKNRKEQQRELFSMVVQILLLPALLIPFLVIYPAYQWHTLSPDDAQARIVTPTCARYAKDWERGVVLQGMQITNEQGEVIDNETIASDQTVTIHLIWHALEIITHDWTVFVHVVDSNGAIVAEHNSQPKMDTFPMTLWSPGDWVEDMHPITLPSTLPDGKYTIRAGWYKPWTRDPQKGSRQQVWDCVDNTHVGDFAEVGKIVVGKK